MSGHMRFLEDGGISFLGLLTRALIGYARISMAGMGAHAALRASVFCSMGYGRYEVYVSCAWVGSRPP
jgi:hypothetical protein